MQIKITFESNLGSSYRENITHLTLDGCLRALLMQAHGLHL